MRLATNIIGSNVINHTTVPMYISTRHGRDSADYIQHYLDSMKVTDERANFSVMFNRSAGELPEYLEYQFRVKANSVPQSANDTMFVDAWYHMPVDTKSTADGDPYGLLLNYSDTLDVDSKDFYDEDIDSRLDSLADNLSDTAPVDDNFSDDLNQFDDKDD